jgi:hypothetical protein
VRREAREKHAAFKERQRVREEEDRQMLADLERAQRLLAGRATAEDLAGQQGLAGRRPDTEPR